MASALADLDVLAPQFTFAQQLQICSLPSIPDKSTKFWNISPQISKNPQDSKGG
jgi:hypothetical protein